MHTTTDKYHQTKPSRAYCVAIARRISSLFATDSAALDAIRAGATGFCAKADPVTHLPDAVRIVATGDAVVAPKVLRALLKRLVPRTSSGVMLDGLTSREREVLRLVSEGANNIEIGEILTVSIPTVRTHISHLRSKLGARTRAELVVRAWESNL